MPQLVLAPSARASEELYQGVQVPLGPLSGTVFLWGPSPSPMDHSFYKVYKTMKGYTKCEC